MGDSLATLLIQNSKSQLLLTDLTNESGVKKNFGLFMAGDNGKALLNVSLEELKKIRDNLSQSIQDIELINSELEEEKQIYYQIKFVYNKKELTIKNTALSIDSFYDTIQQLFNKLYKSPVSTKLLLDFIDQCFYSETNNLSKFSDISHVVEILSDDYDQLLFKTQTFLAEKTIRQDKLSFCPAFPL